MKKIEELRKMCEELEEKGEIFLSVWNIEEIQANGEEVNVTIITEEGEVPEKCYQFIKWLEDNSEERTFIAEQGFDYYLIDGCNIALDFDSFEE